MTEEKIEIAMERMGDAIEKTVDGAANKAWRHRPVRVIAKTISFLTGAGLIASTILIFVMVGIGHVIDTQLIGSGDALRTAVIFFYISNEGVSLLENAGHIGLPIPEKLKEVLAQLHNRTEDDKDTEDKE